MKKYLMLLLLIACTSEPEYSNVWESTKVVFYGEEVEASYRFTFDDKLTYERDGVVIGVYDYRLTNDSLFIYFPTVTDAWQKVENNGVVVISQTDAEITFRRLIKEDE